MPPNAMAGVMLIWIVIRLRVRTVARAIQARADARVDERIRISRDLHDTLLQGIQVLLLHIHVAAQKIAPNSVSRSILDDALAAADRIVIEGRNRVGGLRTEQLTNDELVGSLNNLCRDLNLDDRIKCSLERPELMQF
jgi:signal transduction histidine kinase